MKRPPIAAASLLLLLSITISPALSFAGDFFGELGSVNGTVEILKPENTEWLAAADEMPVEPKDRIRTLNDSSCNIELDDGSLIYVGENTQASIEFLELTGEKHTSRFSLWLGKVIASVSKTRSVSMEIHTPVSVNSVRGTEFAVETTETKTDVGVFEGKVTVQSKDLTGEELDLLADQETSVPRDMKPERPRALNEVMLRNRERLDGLRTRIKDMRERLKRIPPEQRREVRRNILQKHSRTRETLQMRNKDLRMKRKNHPRGIR